MSFDALPTELYEAIFDFLDPTDFRQIIVNVTRAIPLAPLPLEKLFQIVRLTRPEQAILLYNRIRPQRISSNANIQDLSEYPAHSIVQAGTLVKELAVETWTVDADILINLVRLLPNLQSLVIWIGPTNFAPEHLEELFAKPFKDLRYLSLRFRPYVEKATYYQFLKGAYFDSTLTALSLWPPSGLPTLSIVQDPLDAEKAKKQGFAQPIVFFRLDLLPLLHSPAFSQSLKHLRLRIPFRAVARSLCGSTSGSARDKPPDLEFLDLSTCGISEAEIDIILARFTTLKHIILDGCSVLRGDLREGESIALGKRLALIGVKRAKDREKELKTWLESKALAEAIGTDGSSNQGTPVDTKRPKPGRKGLATATISFRTEDPPPDPAKSKVPVAKVPVNEPTNPIVTEELAAVPGKTPKKVKYMKPPHKEKKQTAGSSKALVKKKANVTRIRVLPTFSALQSLSLTLSSAVKEDRHEAIRAEFEEGWAEGVAQIARTRARLRTSSENGFRVMRLCSYEVENDSEGSVSGESFKEGLYGLEDVDKDSFGMPDEDIGRHLAPPVLCFVGPLSDKAHKNNCGHAVGWEVMKDEY